MIEKFLGELSRAFWATEENQRLYAYYHDMTKTEGWKTHQTLLVKICNELSVYMFSKEFTELTKEEKDTQQRAFVMTKEIIDFLMNPLKGAERMAAIQQYNQKLESTMRKKPKGAKNDGTNS